MKPHKSLDIVSWRSQPALAMKTTQSSELFFSKQKKCVKWSVFANQVTYFKPHNSYVYVLYMHAQVHTSVHKRNYLCPFKLVFKAIHHFANINGFTVYL